MSFPELEEINNNHLKWARSVSIKSLVKILKKLSDLYYNTGIPGVSDEVFDDMKGVLAKRDPKNKYLKAVGAPPPKDSKAENLPYPMGSLNKVYPTRDDDFLANWRKKFPGKYTISDKLDGASAMIVKKNGTVKMYSRGDGERGFIITHLLDLININKKALEKIKEGMAIRGELIIPWDIFKSKAYGRVNPRNSVSGIINAKYPDKRVAATISFVTHGIIEPRYKHNDQLAKLSKMGFDVVPYSTTSSVISEALAEKTYDRSKISPYPIDGLVCHDESKVYEHEGGYPTYAFAFKIVGEVMDAKVIKVDWKTSRHAQIKPRIFVEPTKLSGATVERLTAHHANYVVSRKLGEGAIVKIVRSGEVIPYIVKVEKPSDNVNMPNIDYVWDNNNVNIIAVNKTTPGIKSLQMNFFFKTIGVKHISEQTLFKLAEHGYDDIFKFLSSTPDEMSKVKGVSEKVLNKVFKGIDDSMKNLKLPTLMAASGVFGKGIGTKKLAEVVSGYPDLLKKEWTNKELYKALISLEGFAEKTSKQFVKNFNEFVDFFNRLTELYNLGYLLEVPKKKSKKKSRFIGMKIVFTGFRNDDLKDIIESEGGKVTSSVSKNTDLLVYKGEPGNSKYKKAMDIGIKLMSLVEFKEEYRF